MFKTFHYLTLALLLPSLAEAGRPMMTDDARLTAAGSCQIESWVQQSSAQREWWALPACNPGGNLEITAGVAHMQPRHGKDSSSLLLQAKTMLKPLSASGYGVGLAAGGQSLSGNDNSRSLAAVYAYVPVTVVVLPNDRLTLNANLGWTRDRVIHLDELTWGLGVSSALSARTSAFTELYGDNQGAAGTQAGLSYQLLPNRLQLDLTAGTTPGSVGGDSLASVGLNYYFP